MCLCLCVCVCVCVCVSVCVCLCVCGGCTGKSTNRDTARIAMAKAKAQLFKERHNKVAMEAQAEYRQRNPPIKIPKKLLRFP